MIDMIFSLTMSLKSGVYFALNSAFQFGLVIFQVLNSYVELVATIRQKF